MPFISEFTQASFAGTADRRQVSTTRQRFTLATFTLNQAGGAQVYFSSSTQTANPFSSTAGHDGFFVGFSTTGSTAAVLSFLNGGSQTAVTGTWAPSTPTTTLNDVVTNFSAEYDAATNLLVVFTKGGTTFTFTSTSAPVRTGRWAGWFANNGTTASTGEWFRWEDPPTGPTISSITATPSGQTVNVAANVTPQTAPISNVTALLNAVDGGAVGQGPFAMTAGTAPAYSRAFSDVVPGTYTVTISAQDAGGTSTSTSAPFTIESIGGSNPGPNPPTGSPILSGGPFTIVEGQTVCGTITIVDADQQSGHTLTLSGPDAALFTLQSIPSQPMQRQLAFINAPNFEQPLDQGANNVYNVTIVATDALGNASNALDVVVTVTNVVDQVTDLDLLSPSLVSAIVGESVSFTLRAREGASAIAGATILGRSTDGQISFANAGVTNGAGEATLAGVISLDAQFPSSFNVEFYTNTTPVITESCVINIVEPANGYIYLRGRFIPRLLPVQK